MAKPLLKVENLQISYPASAGRFMAVDDVSFTIEPGETFGLVGESGSGKTTTVMAILRLLKPPARIESGRAVMDDRDLLSLSDEEMQPLRWQKLALIPQGAMNSLNPVMRVGDQILDAITAHEEKSAKKGSQARIIEALSSVGLPVRVVRMYPHELSGGMKQRVCIAMAMILNPSLIVADEPTSALDVVVQRMVAETLLDVKERLGASLILIGHDMGLQAQMVDRLGVMYRGKLVEVGPVGEMFKVAVHPYTKLLIASIPSIGEKKLEARDHKALAKTVGTIDGCVLGSACPGPAEDGKVSASPMHEVTPGHLVACEADAMEAIA